MIQPRGIRHDSCCERAKGEAQSLRVHCPRGIYNNNPGNIRWGEKWQGLKENGKEQDSSFCVFKSPEYGIRALAKLLKNYQILYGLNTPRKIINRYAPPNENQTQAYVQSVAHQLGIAPDDMVDLENEATLLIFIKAMIRHENGMQPYDTETILRGIRL